MRSLTIACLFATSVLFGQNTIAFPDVANFSKQTYKAGTQNWDMTQAKNGIVFFANNEGLLSFDGVDWHLYPLPNKTNVRSVAIAPDNKIYVGGQDEIGYFIPGNNGNLVYVSLTGLLPAKYRSFGDVWDISCTSKDIFFRSSGKIFRLSDETFTTYSAPVEWSYMGLCNNKLYAHDFQNGILVFENEQWKPAFNKDLLMNGDPVTSILPYKNDTVLVTTLKNGIFLSAGQQLLRFKTTDLDKITPSRIYNAIRINRDWIALATNNNGLQIINNSGELIQSFTRLEGLQNNNILSVSTDKEGDLWLGLDNGIDMISYSNAIKRITPNGLESSGYAALIFDNKLYAGTSTRLFSVPLQPQPDLSFSRGVFTMVNNSAGQTWGLADINGKLLLGHHEGAFEIRDNMAYPLSTSTGFWNFTSTSAVSPSPSIVAGNYKGISFFNYSDNRFNYVSSVPNFEESSRFVAIDNEDNIWVSHPYHGIYKIAQSASISNAVLYDEKKGLPSKLNNHIYKLRNQVVAATEKGVYQYDSRSDRFIPSAFFQHYLGDQSVRYLKEDKEGNIWFIHEKSLGVLDMSGKDTSIVYLPELNNKLNSGFEFIYPVDNQNIFVGGEKGFFHINYEKYRSNKPALQVQLREVKIIGKYDSLLFGGYFNNVNEDQLQQKNQVPEIGDSWRGIHFVFSSPLYSQQSNIEYSYRLNGFDDNWSPWSSRAEKEYTHLPAGSYHFELKCRNQPDNESPVYSYQFRILPPWYQSNAAYIIYILLLAFGIFLLIKWQQKKFSSQQLRYEEEQKKLQYLHQLEIDKAENELVSLRNEKLQAEVDYKNSELANSAMHLVQKGELLSKIKAELNRVMKVVDNDKTIAELKKMIRTLSEDDKMESDWQNFAQHFDKVQRDFVTSLKERHPSISPNELKLCAYLRMNLSTKEIAQLMNISVRGVEISRYRLRKKLGLTAGANLFDYLIKT